MNRFVSDCWTGIRTGPARAGLAFLSLSLGLFAVTILLATFDALQRQARELVESFGAGSFVLHPSLPDDSGPIWFREQVALFRDSIRPDGAVSGIRKIPDVAGVSVSIMTTDASLAGVRDWHFVEGRPLDGWDILHGARHAMAPLSLCREQNWQLGDILTLGREPFRLVGIYAEPGSPAAFVPQDVVWIPYTTGALETGNEEARSRVDAWVFRSADGTPPEALVRRVAALLRQPGIDIDTVEWVTPESLLRGIRRWQRAIVWTAGTGGILGLMLGGITLAGMLLTGVRERVAEIGLRRALGARPHEIAALFVAEALVLTGAAAIVGAGLAEWTLHALGSRFPLPFHFGLTARILPLALACGLALLCSFGPALFAARMPPAEALRNE